MERARHAIDRALEAWQAVDARRRELVARGRSASSELARALRKQRRESRSVLAAARREMVHAARMMSRLPKAA
jgi:hypothetical protein